VVGDAAIRKVAYSPLIWQVERKERQHMSALSARELRVMYDHLPNLYSATEVQTLAPRAMNMVNALFDSDSVGMSFADPRLPYVVAAWSPHLTNIEKYVDRFKELAPQHPFFVKWKELGTKEKAIRFSDCGTEEQWSQTPLANEFFRPLRIKRLLGTWREFGGGHHLELSVARQTREFSDRECKKLDYLAQHIGQAYLNCKLINELRRDAPLPSQWLCVDGGLNPMRLNSTQDGYEQQDFLPAKGGVSLTDREREVLDWVVEGKTNPEIAIILNISPRTVQKHLERVFQKLSVETRTAAAMRAVELGIARSDVPVY